MVEFLIGLIVGVLVGCGISYAVLLKVAHEMIEEEEGA